MFPIIIFNNLSAAGLPQRRCHLWVLQDQSERISQRMRVLARDHVRESDVVYPPLASIFLCLGDHARRDINSKHARGYSC